MLPRLALLPRMDSHNFCRDKAFFGSTEERIFGMNGTL